ncbi:uncharacterized protein LOC117648421 [Thrips palmi]|uniref:Uncharacterized protein LOC117648421 n=1 Tax=Thrips palmi TaxID=161013 RepID=A0A6P8ZCV7_THRPL|nr:uncharacterized protein LOC117648421 [Thrips palmi]
MSRELSGSFIPSESTCHVIDYSSEHADVAACVQEEGLIILREGRVIGWCDIGEGLVHRISIFFTYQPFCKNYVLQLESCVKVVSHASCLKVTHTFDNVTRFEIGDFSQKGFPQLGLWSEDHEDMRITDLTASSSSSLINPNPVETVLSAKLRGLKVSVERVHKQLEEKRKLRRHCMFHIVGVNHTEHSPSLDKLVPLIGSFSNSIEVKKTTSRRHLVIKNSWQKLLDRKWVLGCDVQNNSSGPLRSLSLCVSGGVHGVADVVEWRVMVQQPRRRGRGADSVYAAVPPRPPAFSGRSAVVEVLGLVSAVLPNGRETWTGLPAWRLSVDEVLRGDLVPFGVREGLRDAEHEDVLASAACCPVPVELRVDGREGLADRVVGLLRDANLRAPDGGPDGPLVDHTLLVGTGPPETPLHGALVLLHVHATNACSLHVRARDARHVLLLAHRLLAGLPQHTRLRAVGRRRHDADLGTPALARALIKALSAELRAVTARDRRLPRDALHALEVATDLAAQALSARSCR